MNEDNDIMAAYEAGDGCSVPIFNHTPVDAAGRDRLVELAKLALIRKLLEEFGSVAMEGWRYRLFDDFDPRYDHHEVVVDSMFRGRRFGLCLKFRVTQ